MKPAVKNTIFVLLVIFVAVLFARFVVFKEQFDNMGEGLERVAAWQEQYMKDHPDATKEQMDAAFDASIAELKVWQAQYKKDHPNATQEEMNAAFSAAWKK